MKLTNIRVGDNYNYKTLCEKLEEPYKNSCSKTAQLKAWHRYFNWEKQGQKYFITEIYADPPPPPPLTRNKISKYADLLYPLIINDLYENLKKTGYSVLRKSQKRIYRDWGFAKDIASFDLAIFEMFIFKPELFQQNAKDKPKKFDKHIFREAYKLYKNKFKSNFELYKCVFEEVRANFIEVASRIVKRAIDNLNKTQRINCQQVYYVYHLIQISNDKFTESEEEPLLANDEEEKIIIQYLEKIKQQLKNEKQSYSLIHDYQKSNYLYEELNKCLLDHKLKCEYTLWQFSLFDKKTDIASLYHKCFRETTPWQCKKNIFATVQSSIQGKNKYEVRQCKGLYNNIEMRKYDIFMNLIQRGSNGLIDTQKTLLEYALHRNYIINTHIRSLY